MIVFSSRYLLSSTSSFDLASQPIATFTTAADGDDRAGHEFGVVAAQEGRDGGDFVGLRAVAQAVKTVEVAADLFGVGMFVAPSMQCIGPHAGRGSFGIYPVIERAPSSG